MSNYTLKNKPNFTFNEEVLVDFGRIYDGAGTVKGKIVGKSSEGILDVWLVQFDIDILKAAIPDLNWKYNTIAISHTFFVNIQ